MNRIVATLATLVVVPLALGAQLKSTNAAAQKAYEQGLDLVKNGQGVKPLEKALAAFQQAVALDPQFAAAHARLSMTYTSLGPFFNYWSPERTASQSLHAAERALALNDRLPEAHLAMAWVNQSARWDWAGVEQSFKKAVSLQPGTFDAYLEYAYFLTIRGRGAEAEAQYQKAQTFGLPSMTEFEAKVARTADRKELNRLVEAKAKDLKGQPPSAYWMWNLAFASSKARNWAAAEKFLLQQIPLMEGDVVDEVALLGHILGLTGRKADALKRLAQLDEIEKSGLHVSPVLRAWIHLGVGDKNRAFAYLDQAVTQRAHRCGLDLKWFDFVYDTVRDDPRFTALLKKMNL